MNIPKIIHQVYEGSPSELLLELSESWKELHPEWEYRFWTHLEINRFLVSFYPELIEPYRNLKYDVQRWDAIRYLILFHHGGLYADMDYECINSMEELIQNGSCFLGAEPTSHAALCDNPFI